MSLLPPEPAASLREKLLLYRKRLLDLSLQNRLLSWKPSKRFTLDLKEIGLVEAYEALVVDEGGSVDLVPKYDEETYSELGKKVPNRTGFVTGLDEEDLATKCLRTRRESDALERDSGINHLHLIFGFMEWYEDRTSEKVLKAPIILVPARLVRTGTNSVTGLAEYSVEYDQTEVIVNPSLVEKLKQDYNINLPVFSAPEGEVPDSGALTKFLEELGDIARSRPRWKFNPDIRLSFVSFAKLRMYRDLDPNQWSDEDALESNHLIQSLFGLASANEGADSADTGRTIEEDPKADALPLVLTADSSQHRAIADACRGLNMVIEGPPGTGKSQSITNIIAALMAEGKSVLFVAEKFAALDVVKRNLESVGLGSFCFELHGTKASKPAVYAELRARLEQKFPFPRRIASVRNEWKSARKTLNDYVAAASKRIGPREETFFEIVGKVEWLRSQKLNPPPSLTGNGRLDGFHEREQFLVDSEQLIVQRAIRRKHGWLDLEAGNLPAGHEDQLIQPLPQVLQLLEFLIQCEAFINGTLQTKAHLRLEDCIGLTPTRLAPFAITESILWSAKKALSKKSNRDLIEKCCLEAAEIRSLEAKTAIVLPEARRALLPAGTLEALQNIADRPLYKLPVQELLIDSFKLLTEQIARLGNLRLEASQLQLDSQNSLAGISTLQDQVTHFRALTPAIQNDLAEDHFQNGLSTLLERSKQEGTALTSRREALSKTFSLVGDLPPVIELRQIREDLKIHGANILGRIFSGKYRQAKKATYRWLTLPSVFKYPGIIGELEQLEGLSIDEDAFNSEPSHKRMGTLFKGVHTDWFRLEACVSWAASAKNCGLTFPVVSSSVVIGHIAKIRELEDQLNRLWKEMAESITKVETCGVIEKKQLWEMPLKDLSSVLVQWHTWLNAWILPIQLSEISEGVTFKDLSESLQTWESIDGRKTALSEHKGLRNCLGTSAVGIETDWLAIKATEEWLDAMQKAGLPTAWYEGLLALDQQASWAEVIQVISQSAEAWQEIMSIFESFQTHLPDATKWVKEHITPELAKRVDVLMHEAEFLPSWAQFCRLRRKADELGIAPYFHAWESGDIEETQLADMFRLVEYRRLAATETQTNPALRNFVAEPHEQIRRQFRKLDAELIQLTQQEIAATIGGRKMPEGVDSGPRRDWTDGALVRHQVSLQRKQLPLRLLMSRALPAVKALKPCFMMSPLTVAQFLEPNLPKFDTLVMDEASQILPEDALGAIARANQIVVVGDPKQLPPTSFFRISSDDDGDDDDDTLLEAAESILETCDAAFNKTRRLQWHYRSLHESLIAFSNTEFYGDLLVFPSPIRDTSKYGVRFHKVEGLYVDNRNQIEAEAVVEAIVNQLRSSPSTSIGVITFNLKQKELIEDLLSKKGRSDPLLAELIERAEGHVEPLIIRNLESIQGEQRDVIFISVNYGPQTPGGPVAQRFGPVNSKTGWRRLNVMFSRAKERMEVFSCMTADNIVAEPDAKTGAAYLKRFLHYAETGRLEAVTPFGKRAMDSDFERSVAEHVRQLGYDVEAQIGVAGFFIDLGVFPPGRRDRFMIGIECDGAAYHSSRVARDRDRIREDVLRGRGWNLYRIWSTDWFQDRTAAMRKLSQALKAAHP